MIMDTQNELKNAAAIEPFASLPLATDDEASQPDIELSYEHQAVYQPYLGSPRLVEIVNKDLEIIQRRMEKLNECGANRPRVGDFYRRLDGSLQRFVHDWGSGHGIQVYKAFAGSFYLGHGNVEYSGALDPCVPYDRIQPTDETMLGSVWIFSQGLAGAHRGVTALVRFRVFQEVG